MMGARKRVFRSKVGMELVVPMAAVFTSVVAMLWRLRPMWPWLLILLPAVIFSAYTMLAITYTIDGRVLIVRSGFLYKRRIAIDDIRLIKRTGNPLSAPAASLDRLEIRHGLSGTLVSPARKDEFIAAILDINPKVEVQLGK
ncbi:MAG TPA: PH domain-containing protein [Flavobacteriales bacterium]|nr:PH domain-containing protein [Flavobacteriales bacterium]